MENLKSYINDYINLWSRFSGKPEMEFPPTKEEDVIEILDSIEGNLSPENLHCDGEISHAEANRKYKYFMRVQQELVQLVRSYRTTNAWNSQNWDLKSRWYDWNEMF